MGLDFGSFCARLADDNREGRLAGWNESDRERLVDRLLEYCGWGVVHPNRGCRVIHQQWGERGTCDFVLERDGRVVGLAEVKAADAADWPAVSGRAEGFIRGREAELHAEEPTNAVAQLSTYCWRCRALADGAIAVLTDGVRYAWGSATELAGSRARAEAEFAGQRRSVGFAVEAGTVEEMPFMLRLREELARLARS